MGFQDTEREMDRLPRHPQDVGQSRVCSSKTELTVLLPCLNNALFPFIRYYKDEEIYF